jgi:hypothetical protein
MNLAIGVSLLRLGSDLVGGFNVAGGLVLLVLAALGWRRNRTDPPIDGGHHPPR